MQKSKKQQLFADQTINRESKYQSRQHSICQTFCEEDIALMYHWFWWFWRQNSEVIWNRKIPMKQHWQVLGWNYCDGFWQCELCQEPHLEKAINSVRFVAQHVKNQDRYNKVNIIVFNIIINVMLTIIAFAVIIVKHSIWKLFARLPMTGSMWRWCSTGEAETSKHLWTYSLT